MFKRIVSRLGKGGTPDPTAALAAAAAPVEPTLSYEKSVGLLTAELNDFIRQLDEDLTKAFKANIILHNLNDGETRSILMLRDTRAGIISPTRIDLHGMPGPQGGGSFQVDIQGPSNHAGVNDRTTLGRHNFSVSDISGVIGCVYENIVSQLTCEEAAYLEKYVETNLAPAPAPRPR